LSKNTIQSASGLPLVHSTSAYEAKRIVASGRILPAECDLFTDEKLSYFFYGRPAYKRVRRSQIAHFWELPSVFIFEYSAVKAKRIFPFDTGAFSQYPDFINMMPMDQFEVSSTLDAPHRIVGAFFVDSNRYFRMNPRGKESFINRFDVTVDDEEVMALHELMISYSEVVDDRRAAIEVQSDVDLSLKSGELLAVVFPEEYVDSEQFMAGLKRLSADALPYSSFPLKQEMYYSTIYTTVFDYYRRKNFAR
jgi:hypothetical protein